MQNGQITIAPNAARNGMVVRLALNGAAPISAELTAPKVGEVIEKVARVRAALADRALSDLGPATVLEFAAVDPGWRASADIALKGESADSIALGLQHPSYGWLCFILPDEHARRLGEWLLANATSQSQVNNSSGDLEDVPHQA
jgi:hypothetical protein